MQDSASLHSPARDVNEKDLVREIMWVDGVLSYEAFDLFESLIRLVLIWKVKM